MSNIVHCLFCFEVLLASLEKRIPLDLSQVERLWAEYTFYLKDTGRPEDCAPGEDQYQDETENEGHILDAPRSSQGPDSCGQTLAAPQPRRVAALTPSTRSSSSSTPVSTSTSSSSQIGSSQGSASSSTTSFSSINLLQIARTKAIQPRNEEYPLFVTWNTIGKNASRVLRGCIGTFDAQGLEVGLKNYALTSAFEDSRFSPLSSREVPNLECSVTLLTDFELASTPMDWELGTHGLRISFVHRARRLGATYLPDVAKDQGWSKMETLLSLMRKAGWNGRREEWNRVNDLTVTKYRGSKSSADYTQWRAWRDWVDEQRGSN